MVGQRTILLMHVADEASHSHLPAHEMRARDAQLSAHVAVERTHSHDGPVHALRARAAQPTSSHVPVPPFHAQLPVHIALLWIAAHCITRS